MTTVELNVKNICDELFKKDFSQIVIDLVQETEDLIREDVSRDAVGAACYDCSVLLEVFNPELKADIDLLTRLHDALEKWRTEIERRNIILGIPREQ